MTHLCICCTLIFRGAFTFESTYTLGHIHNLAGLASLPAIIVSLAVGHGDAAAADSVAATAAEMVACDGNGVATAASQLVAAAVRVPAVLAARTAAYAPSVPAALCAVCAPAPAAVLAPCAFSSAPVSL